MRNLISRVIEASRPELKWPNTTPPDKTDRFWELNNNLNVNGVPYKKEEVSPGKWEWVVDKAILKRQRDYEQHKRDLAVALQTRVLSEAEMAEVMTYGPRLFIHNMVSYHEADKQKEFNEAICQQHRLRSIAPPMSQKRTITVHVEGGMVQDVNGIPPGYEVRVEDRDEGDTSHPSWDKAKGCFVTVYGGDGV